MNKSILNTGLWSAIICLASFIVWIISFSGIAVQSPLFTWTNIEDYIDYYKSNSQFFQYSAKSFMIIFSLAYMILTMVLYECTATERKILAKIAVVFSIMFALVSSMHYFVQISFVRFAIAGNEYSGLEHFIQSNPTSFLSSVNMLGWTLFLGLSSLFMYAGFTQNSVAKRIRPGLLINSVSCILGGNRLFIPDRHIDIYFYEFGYRTWFHSVNCFIHSACQSSKTGKQTKYERAT